VSLSLVNLFYTDCKVWLHLLSSLIDFRASSSGNLSVEFLRGLRKVCDSNVFLIYGIMHACSYSCKILIENGCGW